MSSLGLLARDSIQDLEVLRREASSSSSTKDNKTLNELDSLAAKEETGSYHSEGSSERAEQLGANPQQAQEDDSTAEATPATGATPATAQEVSSSSSSSYGRYAGFHADYEGYNNYFHHDTYAPAFLGERNKKQATGGFLCCLFPWFQQSRMLTTTKDDDVDDDSSNKKHDESQERSVVETNTAPPLEKITRSVSEDEVSASSDTLGEKLSDKDRHAVLARLGLAQPDDAAAASASAAAKEGSASSSTSDNLSNKKGLLNDIPTYDTSPLEQEEQETVQKPLRGILKHRSAQNVKTVSSQASSSSTKTTSSSTTPTGPKQQGDSKPQQQQPQIRRRSLFPSYDPSLSSMPKKSHDIHISFAPMARVVTVKSKNNMDLSEKADIWWQKSDYEDFRRTGRIITKAMLQGGSEIWLTETSGRPSSSSSQDRPELSSTSSLSKSSSAETTDTISEPRDKWWHKFGHSRRGLEHVVSFDEGRQRQMNVRTAIHSVLEEQARQKRYKTRATANNNTDEQQQKTSEKLRSVSLHHTAWARDLAMAAGASDADAVQSSFSSDRKSREFYLLKFSRSSPVATQRRMPEFMQPAMHGINNTNNNAVKAKSGTISRRLDAHTASQIRFRRDQTAKKSSAQQQQQISSEPIRDPDPEERTNDSLAQRAKGFSSGEDLDMAAVLSGMGAVPQEPHQHATHTATAVASQS